MFLNLHFQRLKRGFFIFLNEPMYTFRQIIPRGRNLLNKTFSNISSGYSFSLKQVFFVLTFKCNLKCKMCTLWGEEGILKKKSVSKDCLNLQDWMKVIDDISKYSPSIIFFGGEPLLYNDWYKIAKYAKKKKLRCNLPTNGTKIKENILELIEVMDNIDISLEGTKDIHNKITGKEGAFEEAVEGMRLINKIKKEKNLKTPYLNGCFTISSENYHNLVDLVNYFENEKIEINLLNFQTIEFVTEDVLKKQKEEFKNLFGIESNFWDGDVGLPKDVDVEHLIEQIKIIKKGKYKNINFIEFEPDFNEDDLRKYFKRKLIPEKKCLASWFEAMIMPDGEVWLCPDYSIGNIKSENFSSLWNNEKARNFRNILNKRKIFPVCGSCYATYLY